MMGDNALLPLPLAALMPTVPLKLLTSAPAESRAVSRAANGLFAFADAGT